MGDLFETEDDGAAAEALLAAGIAIYYRDQSIASDGIVKEYPNGRREVVRATDIGEVLVRHL
ncbi:hypothetical protein H3309_13955 [Sandaracinobacteroides saxicola]|uniref:Uncharacterized protein n=1 Tax=Sandaracinobacteroides saxicola TaxID=2759707 RepID=A0A7G5IMV4_9SPHN|nr:hypothetical protein H3309_13955 [Sandaracinobacteroides saxicola]